MADVVAVIVLVVIVGAAVAYIVQQKRAGVKCIGCSVGQECAKKAKAARAGDSGCGCGCGCSSAERMSADVEKALD